MGGVQSTPIAGEFVTLVDSAGRRRIAAGSPGCDVLAKSSERQDSDRTAGSHSNHISEVTLVVAATSDVVAKVVDGGQQFLGSWADANARSDSCYMIEAARYLEPAGDNEAIVKTSIWSSLSVGHGLSNDSITATGIVSDGLSADARSLCADQPAHQGVSIPQSHSRFPGWTIALDMAANHTEHNAVEEAIKAKLQLTDPLTASDRSPRSTSLVGTSNPAPPVVDVRPLVALDDLKKSSDIVKAFDTPIQALQALEPGQRFSFARLSSGSIIVASHKHLETVGTMHADFGHVALACFVPPEADIIAAGDIHIDETGSITYFECQSDALLMPLGLDVDTHRTSPHLIKFQSLVLTDILSAAIISRSQSSMRLKKVLVYSATLLWLVDERDPSWASISNARYLIAFHELDNINIVGLYSTTPAHIVYDAIPSQFAKIMLDRYESRIIASHGKSRYVLKCEEEARQLRSSIVLRGRNLTVPLQVAPFVVAFHRQDCVKMLGCPDEDAAWKLYSQVNQNCARVIIDRRSSEVLVSYGLAQWIEYCKEAVLRLSASDDVAHVQVASYILAFHDGLDVVTVGYNTAAIARDVYNALSLTLVKTLRCRDSLSPIACHGRKDVLEVCNERITELFAINAAAPLEGASHIVALHQAIDVRMIGFSTQAAASAFFGAISPIHAKICIDMDQDLIYLESGGEYWVNQCTRQVHRRPPIHHPSSPSTSTPHMVAFHGDEGIQVFSFSTLESARSAYDSISTMFAKVLVEGDKAQTLQSYGSAYYTSVCEARIREVYALQCTTPLQDAPYIISVCQADRVRVVGFPTLPAATRMYDALAEDRPKVIMHRRALKPLSPAGLADDVVRCISEVRRLGPMDDSAPLRTTSNIVAFHKDGRVHAIGFSGSEAASAFYGAVSKTWAKILIDDSKMTSNHGRRSLVEQCFAESRSPSQVDFVAPLSGAIYVVAFHVNDCIGLLGFSEAASATTVYDVISTSWAKVLVNMETQELTMSYGNPECINECRDMIMLI